MADVYLARLQLPGLSTDVDGPIELNRAVTLGAGGWIWGVTQPSLEGGVPKQGDILVFYSGHHWIEGIGRVFSTTTDPTYNRLFEDSLEWDERPSVERAMVLSEYQSVFEHSSLSSLIDYDSITGAARDFFEGLPHIYRVPRELLVGNPTDPRRALGSIKGFSFSRFNSPPPQGGGPEQDFPDDGDGGLEDVDRTGPLLSDQYSARDSLREAARGSVQIIIVLFGIVLAALSFVKQTPQQDGTVTSLSLTNGIIIGLGMIGAASILSAYVLVHTAARPRPHSDSIAKEQSDTNDLIAMSSDEQDISNSIRDFSNFYHYQVDRLREKNHILGIAIGSSVALALSGVILTGFEIGVQVSQQIGRLSTAVWLYIVLIIAIVFIGILDRDTILEFVRNQIQ